VAASRTDIGALGSVSTATGVGVHARLFIHFGSESLDPRVLGWPYPLNPPLALVGVDPADGPIPAGGWFAWRMVGPNNRELGRSAATFAGYPACRGAVAELQSTVDGLAVSIVSDPATGRWSWRGEVAATPVAMCGRWYARERECRGSADRFRQSVPVAEVVADITTLRDRRRLDAPRLAAEGRR
jgi:hypothetical protein